MDMDFKLQENNMKGFIWLLTGVGLGVAVTVLFNQPQSQEAPGSSEVENAADNASLWGGKQRVKGTSGNLVGKVKKNVGKATGNDSLAGEGLVDEAVGAVKDTAGKAASAVSETLRDVN
jgi:uncharacterized protein YjbJ (UPF0337 family)